MKDLIETLLGEKKLTKQKSEDIKRRWASKHRRRMPLSSKVLEEAKKVCNEREFERLRKALLTKPTRTISGVAVIAVAAKPHECPGKCTYCPKGADAPQSYTGHEPAIMRALHNDYDPYKQVENRLEQLQAVGHNTDKCELIIMGGTFPSLSEKYQKQFVKRCFDAFNAGSPGAGLLKNSNASSGEKSTGKTSRAKRDSAPRGAKNLAEAQRLNETAKNRVIGLTLETRPDFVRPKKFLELGATRVELGIQCVDDDILAGVKRSHTVKDSAAATRKLKENGYKILYQVMLGLPGSTFEKDVQMFKTLFEDERFKPDMLKIYPTLVVKGSELYKMWKNGSYEPIDEDYVMKVLEKVYELAPSWVRIHRVQRDIPSDYIEAGPVKSNLRQEINRKYDEAGKTTREIRFREAGQMYKRRGKTPLNAEISVEKYKASGGDEYFISVEDKKQNILLGFCRLRIAVSGKAFVRELHVYGETLPVGSQKAAVQHSGWGKRLLAKAESIAKQQGIDGIFVISGIGVREYYRKLGYKLREGYMWKPL